ncbi:acyl-CoA dehydrogenase family protein [Novosphingobium sp. fls2-241-R2A-195]|jgi:alkylation response protein AidB-like acyl-CoA dehydrogenase|uniref:acyl-CoA dehydrogenase family protein n=1 Tax=Novosphingobium sp. fls2-241-R2A-195 TaxID=3040296 RepID=UPI00254AFA09|nr:acyl-CoA dehydrogenase family protein [Novosphingobium sp. fls2-241-R2A-195]
MSFARTDTQRMLADMAGRLLAQRNEFEARRHRLAAAVPERMALWPDLAEQGILGAAFPEELGGFGGTMRDLATVMEAAGRHLLVEPLASGAVAGWLLAQAGEPVEPLIGGERVVVLAHDEGLDSFAPRRVTAQADGAHWQLSGTKRAVRHADLADAWIVTAEIAGALACLLVEADAPSTRREPTRLIDGSSAATLHFDRTPARRLAIDAATIEQALARHACALAAESVAILGALCERTAAYLKTRKQFGVPLASFQALQHRLAEMMIATGSARALTERAIAALDAMGDTGGAGALASAAKALADDAGRLVGHEAVQMHGGMGVSDELDVSHYMRRLAAIRATQGSAAVHRAHFAGAADLDPAAEDDGELAVFRAEVAAFVRDKLPEDIRLKGEKGLEFGKDDFVRWQKLLRAEGWFAGAWPEDAGGQGWDLNRQLAFVQEAGRSGAPLIIPYGVNMVGPVIQTFGNAAQQARHLPGILSSDVWWCQGYSEPNAGSDLASLKTTAVREGDHYVVNGTKMWTTEAHWADWMHCLVRTDREVKPQAGISFLLIDMTTPGIEVRPIVTIDGQHHTNQVFFDDVRVPVENLVGHEGQGWTIAKFLLANERVAIADTGPKLKLLGVIKAMFAQLRGAEGDTAQVALIADRLADAEIQLTALCALERDYVRGWQQGGSRDGPEASILKVRGTEILQLLSELALAIEGPLGAVHDPADLHLAPGAELSAAQQASAMAHHYLYGRCWSIFGGTNEIQRGLIARAMLG